eukprot:TRINITY_DN16595_c0_g1_i2.p1 TRINITY_DN16595_c0_g1~~TRINITY_DN16595_c0_g1_i2.p1  ORF type:complete len:150 (-),score=38.37 TRINITY_DN16595_c0_g1_i2:253-654(-)
MLRSLVGSEMCIRDRYQRRVRGFRIQHAGQHRSGVGGSDPGGGEGVTPVFQCAAGGAVSGFGHGGDKLCQVRGDQPAMGRHDEWQESSTAQQVATTPRGCGAAVSGSAGNAARWAALRRWVFKSLAGSQWADC